MVMFRCISCDEIFVSAEVKRDILNRRFLVRLDNIKYCPFCGGEVEWNDYKKRSEKDR